MSKEKTPPETEGKVPPEELYTKAIILKLDQYKDKRDLLSVLLDAGKTYTLEEVDGKIEKFMKGKVN